MKIKIKSKMKTLYLDIFSGISGDMFIGALIDLEVDAHKLERDLKKLKLDGYHLHVSRQHKSTIEGVKFDVHLAHEHDHHHHDDHGHEHHHDHEQGHHQEHEKPTADPQGQPTEVTMRPKRDHASYHRRDRTHRDAIEGVFCPG